jgi:alpha-maltose-1-phosphate synthase
MNKLKYILSGSAKFLLFETGRILHQRNQLEKIICGYPWFKLKKENIPKDLVISSGLYNILKYPFWSFQMAAPYNDLLGILNKKNIDKLVCNFLEKNDNADVLLGLAGVSLNSAKKFLNNDKIFVCERTSSHISYQNKIMIEENKKYGKVKKYEVHSWFIENELKEYEMADVILVPSNFVKNSFDEKNINKVKVIELGANIDNFFPIPGVVKSEKYFDIIFIGQKTLRKGLHYLIEAFQNFKHPHKRLHVIGSDTDDKKFFQKKLNEENIIVYGHVPQLELNDIINKCHVFVLPSIEDGFGIVALQAAATGCPAIVSENTGALDFVVKNKAGIVVPIRDSTAIKNSLEMLADDRILLNQLSINAIEGTKRNTWSNYVDKLDTFLSKIKQDKLNNVL